jgi:glycerol-3-phosphate dehydrogenase (NAD(P)+)
LKAAVLGGGSWGTALACQLARCGHEVRIWTREPAIAREINEARTNAGYLPGVVLPAGLVASAELGSAVQAAELVALVVPSQFCREVLRLLAAVIPRDAVLVSATKGLELDTLLRISEVAAAELPGRRLLALSGPSFALEVAREQPTAVVLASAELALAERLQRELSSRCFRVYASDDVLGVELGGALKNVIAIAAGIVDGLGHGHNTVAALITRGLAEISRLALACGGRAETLAGLAGLGDLVLTCTGSLSRNRSLGQALGRGETLEQALHASARMVVEGVRTTLAACELSARARIEMPIARQMREVLYAAKPPRAAVDELMLRTLKRE